MAFLPHGTCLLWNPSLLALHIASDGAIAIAYFTISAALALFIARRREVPHQWLVIMFGTFIALCATTHVMEIVTIWSPVFWTSGIIKAATAVISVTTAAVLLPLIPKASSLPKPGEIERLHHLLADSQHEKEHVRDLFERERRVATRFQAASLPLALPEIPGFRLTSFYETGSSELNIGGDWYDAMRLVDGRLIISIGDVSGSGLNAAVVMTSMRQVLRGVAHLHPDPVLMLDAADRTLRTDHPHTVVSAFVAVVDPVSMTMQYASAGHPPPLLRTATGTVNELPYRGMILGLRSHDDAPAATITLEPGMTLLFYTDGLIESTRDFEHGERQLHDCMRNLVDPDSPRLAKHVNDLLLHDGSRDDVAILSLHIGAETSSLMRSRFHTFDAAAARDVRLRFVAELEARGLHSDDRYAAELVYGELIGNTVRYAPGMVEVTVDWTGIAPVLHVSDEGPGFWHMPKLPSDLLSESGRGLFLVKSLTADFSVSKKADGGSHARAVLATRAAAGARVFSTY